MPKENDKNCLRVLNEVCKCDSSDYGSTEKRMHRKNVRRQMLMMKHVKGIIDRERRNQQKTEDQTDDKSSKKLSFTSTQEAQNKESEIHFSSSETSDDSPSTSLVAHPSSSTDSSPDASLELEDVASSHSSEALRDLD